MLFLALPYGELASAAREPFLDSALAWMNPPAPCTEPFIRGDTNGSGGVDIADSIYLLAFLFQSGAPVTTQAAGDINSDGNTDIADVVYLLTYLFNSGTPPAAPFPTADCE